MNEEVRNFQLTFICGVSAGGSDFSIDVITTWAIEHWRKDKIMFNAGVQIFYSLGTAQTTAFELGGQVRVDG